jgi:heme-degrading monooxygenase HmoA
MRTGERRASVIARIWRGRTPPAQADTYFAFLQRTGIKDYRATEGNRGVRVLRRLDGEEAEFMLISLWESLEAVRRFAGDDVERAVYYPEDKDFLLAFEPTVVHYEVLE